MGSTVSWTCGLWCAVSATVRILPSRAAVHSCQLLFCVCAVLCGAEAPREADAPHRTAQTQKRSIHECTAAHDGSIRTVADPTHHRPHVCCYGGEVMGCTMSGTCDAFEETETHTQFW